MDGEPSGAADRDKQTEYEADPESGERERIRKQVKIKVSKDETDDKKTEDAIFQRGERHAEMKETKSEAQPVSGCAVVIYTPYILSAVILNPSALNSTSH